MPDGIKVLAFDDDGFTRDLVHRMLAGAAMQVATFASATDMLDAPEMLAVAVLLLDVNMPRMCGLALQDALGRRRAGLRHLSEETGLRTVRAQPGAGQGDVGRRVEVVPTSCESAKINLIGA